MLNLTLFYYAKICQAGKNLSYKPGGFIQQNNHDKNDLYNYTNTYKKNVQLSYYVKFTKFHRDVTSVALTGFTSPW